MSARKNPAVEWRHAIGHSDLDATTKGVAYAIAAHMNGKAEAFPSQATIAKYSSRSAKTVQREVAKLEKAGWLSVERSYRSRSNYLGRIPSTDIRMSSDDPQSTDTQMSSDAEPIRGHSESDPRTFQTQSKDIQVSTEMKRNERNGTATCYVCGDAFLKNTEQRLRRDGEEQRIPLTKHAGQWWCPRHYREQAPEVEMPPQLTSITEEERDVTF